MRAIGLCLVALLFVAVSGEAFESYEHRALSDAAFLAARRSVLQTAVSPEMLREAEARAAGTVTFGDVTLAVDWFQTPGKLIDPATVDRLIARRRRNLVMRGLAAHHNAEHFQAAALSEWRKFHAMAAACAEGDPRLAILAEAVALHFLQDFFAAGHVVTPRGGMHDAAAGHLHDRFNRRGVAFAIAPLPPEVAAILPWLTPAEQAAYKSAVQRASIPFKGDGYLATNQEQKAFLMVVSTLSIAEVLKASVHGDVQPLQACFSTRQIVNVKVPMQIEGPDGGIRIGEPSAPRVVDGCSSKKSWLGHYGTRQDPELSKQEYDLSGLNVRSAFGIGRRSRDSRIDVEALYIASSNDPPGALIVRDTGKTYPRSAGLLVSLGPSYSRGSRYHAWGLLTDATLTSHTDLISWGFRSALRRYAYGPAHAWRLDYGAKIGVGYQVVNVVLAVDRLHTVDSTGKFAHDYFGSIGVDASFPGTWLRPSRYKRKK